MQNEKLATAGSRRSRSFVIQLAVKRFLDLALAAVSLVVLAPILAAVAAAIRITMGPPVLFCQIRPGLRGTPFRLYKFRTMSEPIAGQDRFLTDNERLTPLGRVLRLTSIDELPQLWNVIKGDLSVVGPRPLLLGYLDRYTARQARRHEMKPGITGWAQVHGRQDIPFSRRLKLDVWYVDHWNLMLDLKILWMTLIRLSSRTGVRPGQHVGAVDDLGLYRSGSERG